jgi:hypothetical protein
MKTILITGTFLLSSFFGCAQIILGGSIFGGISALKSDREEGRIGSSYFWDFQRSFALGGFAQYKINAVISIQADLLYNQHQYLEGYTITQWFPEDRGFHWHRAAHHVSIPILIQFQLKKAYLSAGLQGSYLFHQKTTHTSFGYPDSPNESIWTDRGDLNPFNLEFAGGIGYQTTKNLRIEARALIGSTNRMNRELGHTYLAYSTQFILGFSYSIWKASSYETIDN